MVLRRLLLAFLGVLVATAPGCSAADRPHPPAGSKVSAPPLRLLFEPATPKDAAPAAEYESI